MLAVRQRMDTMERQAVGPPHITTSPWNSGTRRTLSARFWPPHKKMAGKPSETDTIGDPDRVRCGPDEATDVRPVRDG